MITVSWRGIIRQWPKVGEAVTAVLARHVESESEPFEGDFEQVAMHVLLLDCTLSLVLRGFGQFTAFAGRATSSMPFHHATFFACTLLCTFYRKNL